MTLSGPFLLKDVLLGAFSGFLWEWGGLLYPLTPLPRPSGCFVRESPLGVGGGACEFQPLIPTCPVWWPLFTLTHAV